MDKYLFNGQASGMVKSLNSDESKSKTTDQILWLVNATACYVKLADHYKLIKFYDGTILRIQDNILGVVSPDDWKALPYTR